MTNDTLIFNAIASVKAMDGLLAEAWAAREPLPLEQWNLIEKHSRTANSAIIALRQRAAGVKPPKLGD